MFRAWTAALAGIAVLGMARTADAVPMTYAFDMPVFTGGGLAGQTSILEVTVDNGNAAAADQFYFSFDIDGFAVTVGARTLSLGLDPGDGSSYFGNYLYITTDALGVPTLDLTTTRQSMVSFSNPSGDRIGLSTGGYLNFPAYRVVIDGVEGTLQSDLLVSGRPVLAVSEPHSLALFTLGLAGLFLLRHRMRTWNATRVPGAAAVRGSGRQP